MKDNMGTAIGIMVTVIAALILAAVVITTVRSSSNKAKGASQEIENQLAEADAEELRSIDGTSVSGSTVYNYLKDFKDDAIQVVVKTKSQTTTYNYKSTNFADISAKVDDNDALITKSQRKGEKNYINPTGNFEVEVEYDADENPETITFKQY